MQTNPEISTDEFYRIKRLPPYVFAEVNKLKAQLRADGQDIIDFGFGNPDLPTPQHVIDKLIETVQKPRVTGYSASRGIKGLRAACSRYYDRRFGVALDPEDQVIATLGSKEGFANLAQAITAPGDIIYAPDPSYPLHAYGFVIAGAKIQGIPAITADEYLAGVKAALDKAEKPPMAIVVCFPSNPTGMTADRSFYDELIIERAVRCHACGVGRETHDNRHGWFFSLVQCSFNARQIFVCRNGWNALNFSACNHEAISMKWIGWIRCINNIAGRRDGLSEVCEAFF